MTLFKDKIFYLASASPRRRQLLQELDIDIHLIEPRDIEETYPDTLAKDDVAEYISRERLWHTAMLSNPVK